MFVSKTARRHWLAIPTAAALLVALGCQSPSEPEDDESTPQAEESEAVETGAEFGVYDGASEAMEVELPEADEGGETARFSANRGQVEPDTRATFLNVGEKAHFVEAGGEGEVKFAADPERLQRLDIDGATLLVHVPPEASLRLVDDACFGWRLKGPGLDTNAAEAPKAACVADDESCPRQLVRAPSPYLAADPLCDEELLESGAFKRCIRPAHVDIDAEVPSEYVDVGQTDGRHFEEEATVVVTPGECGFPTLRTPKEEVLLAPGVDASWEVTIDDDGRVGGAVSP